MQKVKISLNVWALEERAVPATIRVDYTYDTTNFFGPADRRAAIERVAAEISSRLNDTLEPIIPSGSNRWTASFYNPITDQTITINNPIIAANEIVLYVGGGSFPSSELGIASGGAWTASGTAEWLNTVRARGQAGALSQTNPTDIAPWGGFVGFDASVNWDFGPGAPASNQFDFDSVAAHEILHILGFGLGDGAFERWIINDRFTGPNVQAVYGGPAPVEKVLHGHWLPEVRINGDVPIMVATIPMGTARAITTLDYAALQDIGWEVGVPPVVPPPVSPPPVVPPPVSPPPVVPPPVSPPPIVPPPISPPPVSPPPVTPGGAARFAIGTGSSGIATVAAINSSGQRVSTLTPFGAFAGGARVAMADVNGDGVDDVIVGTGPGTPTQVRVFSGTVDQRLLFSVSPFESSFTGGVYVSAGDLNGDGVPDIVITPDEGGGPRVDVYDGKNFARFLSFFGIDDPNFRGGARSAVGDLNGDGRADLVVAAGFGGGPRVAAFDGQTLTTSRQRVFGDFFAFEQGLRNGSFVSVGDIDGDGVGDLIVGGGPGGAPRVTVFSGAALKTNTYTTLANFFAGDINSRGGVRVAASDVNQDGRDDIITGAGDNAGSRVIVYSGVALPTPATLIDGDLFPGFRGGVFVG